MHLDEWIKLPFPNGTWRFLGDHLAFQERGKLYPGRYRLTME
jgi:hypothetical protein